MFIKIKPFDTLFFRTGRPFSAGVDSWAEIVFTPSPSTFYGALRSFLIFNYGTLEEFEAGTHKLSDSIGWIEEKKIEDKKEKVQHYGKLQVKGIYLCKGEIYIYIPKDIVKIKKEKLYSLSFKQKPKLFVSNYHLSNICVWDKRGQVEDEDGWLTFVDFKDYLKVRKGEFLVLNSEEFFEKEQKIGIKRGRETYTSESGFLYRIPLMRLNKDVAIVAEIDGVEKNIFPESGVMQLGGEGKAVKFEVLSDDPLKEIKDLNFEFKNKNDYFKIYLATPAVFKNGWLPSWIDKDNLKGWYKDVELELVACALGRPISIGGWDLAKNRAKPMRKAVPAGSVYYFKILSSVDTQKVKEAFHFKNISDDFNDLEYSKEGFGLSILGEVKL